MTIQRKPKVSQKPQLSRSKPTITSPWVTYSRCKLCRGTLYPWEARVWLRGKAIGLNHAGCAANHGAVGQ